LFADPDVPLTDENSSMVYRLGETGSTSAFYRYHRTENEPKLEHLGLEPPLQEILSLEREHVIKSHAGIIEHTNADQSADQCIALEEAFGVFVVELQEFSGGSADLSGRLSQSWMEEKMDTDLGEGELNAPNLALAAETVLAGELCGRTLYQLRFKGRALKRSAMQM